MKLVSVRVPLDLYKKVEEIAYALGWAEGKFAAACIADVVKMIEQHQDPRVPRVVAMAQDALRFDREGTPQLKAIDAALKAGYAPKKGLMKEGRDNSK